MTLDEIRDRLQATVEDPMWADHCEVSKLLLKEILSALDDYDELRYRMERLEK